MGREKNSDNFTPKIEALHGGILTQYKQCGRANCKCSNGSLHGPYYYRVWMVRGKRFKKYVKKSERQSVLAALAAYRQKRIKQLQALERNSELVREIRQDNKELRLMLQLIRKGVIKL